MREDLARALADAFLRGPWTRAGLITTGSVVVRRRTSWLPSLVRQVLDVYPVAPLDRPRELAAVLVTRPAADQAGGVRARTRLPAATRVVRNPWHLPPLHDLGDVATRLGLTAGELAWFSDPRRWARRAEAAALQHYRVSSRSAPSGAVRVLEAPKPRLRWIQRRLLDEVLAGVPPHEAAHGFRPGRSAGTHAAEHAGRGVVARLDLEGFFAAVPVARVDGIWRTAGYPEPVAHCLAGLATSVLPLRRWQDVPRPSGPGLLDAHWRLGRRLAAPHLPQGAPTLPALANLAVRRLDVRLSGVAASWGGRYTRYADDLVFSGPDGWRAGTSRLLDLVAEVVRDEGFRLNDRKAAVLPRGGRQVVGGLVVNERARVARAEVDRLRAVLHNCARYGRRSQNREGRPDFRAHVVGRVAWVAQHDAVRGARLRAQLEVIDWAR